MEKQIRNKIGIKVISHFLFALCFFLFVCLLSECIPSNFICSHHSKNLLLTLTNKLFAAHKENTNYYLLKLYCL